jgi:CRISPR type I-E-associated protein CasB/Cse2
VNDHQDTKTDWGSALADAIRGARARYDQLERGKTAAIRRCRTADEVALEGIYWKVGGALAHEQRHLPHVVLLFPLAAHARRARFSVGGYLRSQLGETDGAALRFRRLLDCRDREELDHRLRGVLKLASKDGAPVDWGVLGTDVLWFFAESDSVRRRWAQDFYAPMTRDVEPHTSRDAASTNATG